MDILIIALRTVMLFNIIMGMGLAFGDRQPPVFYIAIAILTLLIDRELRHGPPS